MNKQYERLKKLISEADELIKAGVTSSDINFVTWKDRAEVLIQGIYGENACQYKKFEQISFQKLELLEINGYIPAKDHIEDCRRGLWIAKGQLENILEDIRSDAEYADDFSPAAEVHSRGQNSFERVFIVHGHDGELKESVARIVEKQGLSPVILSEQANNGKTIIEKFEKNSDVGGAICLFTADDLGRAKTMEKEQSRARQNVVFEAGYFMGKLGRNRIVIVAEHGVELPSDMQGIVYTDKADWRVDVLKELKEMGYKIDLNKLV